MTAPLLKSTPKDVIFALIGREIKTRTGNHWTGYLMSVVEPVLHVGILLLVFGALGRMLLPGIDMLVFFALGVVHFLYFRSAYDRVTNAIVANKPLMFYRQVQPVYAAVARAVVEGYVHIATVSLLLGAAFLFGRGVSLQNWGDYLLANLLMSALALGAGLALAVVSAIFPYSKVISGNVLRILYFASCVFYPFALMPVAAQNVLYWNPLVHAIELIRASWLPGYPVSPLISAGYLAAWALGLLVLGAAVYRAFQHRLLSN